MTHVPLHFNEIHTGRSGCCRKMRIISSSSDDAISSENDSYLLFEEELLDLEWRLKSREEQAIRNLECLVEYKSNIINDLWWNCKLHNLGRSFINVSFSFE